MMGLSVMGLSVMGLSAPLHLSALAFAVAAGGAAAGIAAVRCTRCLLDIDLRRALVIASCVVVATVLALRLGDSIYFAPLLAFGWAGVAISAVDLRTHLIPTRLLRSAAAVAIPLLLATALVDGGIASAARTATASAVGGLLGWGLMHVVWLAARGGLGYGDVRLSGYLGMHLGLGGPATVLWGLLAGFAIAAAVGGFGIVALRRSRDHRFALGPSLVLGALAVTCGPVPIGLVT